MDLRVFKTLLVGIFSDHSDGIYVAVEILYFSLFSDQGRVSPDEYVEIGCELILRLDVAGSTDPNFAQRLQIVGRRCLLGARAPRLSEQKLARSCATPFRDPRRLFTATASF